MLRGSYMWLFSTAMILVLSGTPLSGVYAQNNAPIDSLLSILANPISDTARINTLIGLSTAYKKDDVIKEFYYANEALDLAEKTKWEKGKMYAEQLIGDCYEKVTAYNDAINHYKQSISAARTLNNPAIEMSCLKSIAQSYYDMNNMDEMVAYQKATLDVAQREGEPYNIGKQMNSYALRLSDAGKYDEAVRYWYMTLAFVRANLTGEKKDILLADVLNTLATSYVKTHKIDSSLYCLSIAEKLAAPTKDYNEQAYIQSSFCDVYESTGQHDSAEIYGQRTVKMGEALNNLDLQQHYCATLSRVYEADHKPELAIVYLKKYDSLQNIIRNTQKTVGQAMQFAKINIDQQAERNALEKKSLETIRKNQEAALVAALIAVLTFIALTIFIYRNLRQKQRANKIISEQATNLLAQNKIIDSALKEKEVLLKETHHRIKNNLQLISSLLELQAANLADEGAKNALRSAQRRVLSIATVHHKLYGNDENEKVEFSAFTSDLFTRLKSAFANDGKDVHFENTIPATFLKLNTVVLLGLILNELITNSFKHAFTNATVAQINIRLDSTEAIYTLCYSDNGPGIPDGAFDADSGSLGLYLIKRLSKQLKGTASYKYDVDCIFTIIFPNAGS